MDIGQLLNLLDVAIFPCILEILGQIMSNVFRQHVTNLKCHDLSWKIFLRREKLLGRKLRPYTLHHNFAWISGFSSVYFFVLYFLLLSDLFFWLFWQTDIKLPKFGFLGFNFQILFKYFLWKLFIRVKMKILFLLPKVLKATNAQRTNQFKFLSFEIASALCAQFLQAVWLYFISSSAHDIR